MSIQEIMSRMNSRKTVTSAVTAKEAADLILKVAKKHFTGRRVYVDASPDKIELSVKYDYTDLIIAFKLYNEWVEKPAVWIEEVTVPEFDFPGTDGDDLFTAAELKNRDIQRLLKLLMSSKDYAKKVAEDYGKYIDSFNGFLKEINSLVTE